MHLRVREASVLSRRSALTTSLGATAVFMITIAMPRAARAANARLAKAAVQYVDAGNTPHMDCDDCVQFIPGKTVKTKGQCRIVEGEIDPHGHCLAFSPKPAS